MAPFQINLGYSGCLIAQKNNMTTVQIETTIQIQVEKIWEYWTQPSHITQWNQADASWHCPKAENDLRVGGKFCSTMAAKDGSASFDFTGKHLEVDQFKAIKSILDDGRKMEVVFEKIDDTTTRVLESFDTEEENSVELQRSGWQSILDNFKKYSENI